jgi:hypothetical protein
MNIIISEREDIINNNNFAQQQLVSILESLESPNITELKIASSLQGDLDLTILSNEKYSKIKKIVFNEGQITKIDNIPKHINSLECKKNLLIQLGDFSKQLTHLNIDNNYLTRIDITDTNVSYLSCNNNKIVELKLNSNIEELYCEFNDIKMLDLKDFPKLQTLHISNNPLLVLKNMDSINITDFEGENNPLMNLSVSTLIEDPNIEQNELDIQLESKINYLEAISEYFKLKQKYEKKILSEKKAFLQLTTKNIRSQKETKTIMKKLQTFKSKCIVCNKLGGTIFSQKDGYYTAVCGSTQPCKLDIKLFRGYFENKGMMVKIYKDEVEIHKDNIIKQKLDTLLNYISEEQSSKIFKEKIESYNDDNLVFKEVLDTYNNTFNNKERLESLNDKMKNDVHYVQDEMKKLMNEYKDTNNKEILKTLVDTYINKFIPEIEKVRALKYEICEVEQKPMGKKEPNLDILHQFYVSYDKYENCYSEQPKVESFNTKI